MDSHMIGKARNALVKHVLTLICILKEKEKEMVIISELMLENDSLSY